MTNEPDTAQPATVVIGVFLFVILLLFSGGVWLWRAGFDAGNTEAAYRAARDAIAEYHRLADMGDSIRLSLIRPGG